MAGGWIAAGRLPAHQALKWLEEHWDSKKREAFSKAVDRWYSSLPAFRGGTPPDPPEDPDIED